MPDADENQRRGHPVADVLGACFRGAREGDTNVRKRAKSWVGLLTGGGFAVWVAVRLVLFGEEVMRHEWVSSDKAQAEMVAALKEMTQEVRTLSKDLRADREASDKAHSLLLDRLPRPPPKKVAKADEERPWFEQ